MEPPDQSGGNLMAKPKTDKPAAVLQWSRLTSQAETSIKPFGVGALPEKLQWSRLTSQAETFAASCSVCAASCFNGAA